MTNDFRALQPGLRFLGIFTGGMLLSAIAVYGLAPEFPTLAKENRPLENMQVALLLLASLLQVWWANTLGRATAFERTVAVLLAYLCLACALRELDIDRLGDERIFEPLENVLRGMTLAGLVVFLAMNVRGLLRQLDLRRCVRDPVIWYVATAVVLYCLSWPLDKKVVPLEVDHSLMLEEWLELWACASFATAACVRWLGRTRAA
jgi:hypothetical protein